MRRIFNDKTNKINEKVGRNLSDYSKIKRLKFISYSISNRLGHFEQHKKVIQLIYINLNDSYIVSKLFG